MYKNIVDKKAANLSIPRNPLLFTWWATKGSRLLMSYCWIAVVCAVVINRYQFYILGELVDRATEYGNDNGSIDPVWNWMFILIITYTVGDLIWRTTGFSAQRWMTASTERVYNTLFQYLTGHSTRYFQDRFAGSITNKISNAARGVLSLLQMTTWQFISLILGLLADVYLLYSAHYTFAIVLIIWLAIFLSIDIFLVLRLRKLSFAHAKASSELKGKIVDATSNISTVHQQAEELYEHDYVGRYVRSEKNAHMKSWYMFEWILIINGFLLAAFTLVMFSQGLRLFESSVISIGAVVMLITIVFNLEKNLFFLGDQLSRAMQIYGEIDEGLDELLKPHEVTSIEAAPKLHLSQGAISFTDVAFSYPEQGVFSDLNLTIPGGQKIGLVGPSGAGKSTLISILLRQYDLTSGAITIDNQNISGVQLQSLRREISLVPQASNLFHRTILENIQYGRLDASFDEVVAASQKAMAHEFIEKLPDGYKTYVGERGVKLSGGQRQRISIARAILKDTPILILDEATSALDSESEKAIQQALESLMKERTVIAIAHRLSTLRQMDRILVMEDGVIIEDGTHVELFERNGLYAKLWNQQVGGFLPADETCL